MGVLLFNDGSINEAIQQFQTSQRSPKHRIASLYHLAVCFKKKKQYDLALRQLEVAETELPVMDDTRKMVLYELGAVCELLGNREKALQWFKQIYQADIGYRDVAGRVEHAYK
jgi:tetratricopeptide (TPR) repeat protein